MIRLSRDYLLGGGDPSGYDALHDLVSTDPGEAWLVLREMILGEDNHGVLGQLGAGPLENLLCAYAPKIIDEVEPLAKQSPRFFEALASVWTEGIETSARKRISRVTGG